MASSNGRVECADTTGTGIETVEVKDAAPASNIDNPGKEAAFTPGPWCVDTMAWNDDTTHIGCVVAVTLPGHMTAAGPKTLKIGRAKDDQCRVNVEANARLIAAAPDLYAACVAVLDAYNVANPNWSVVANQCAAAIRKAGGVA